MPPSSASGRGRYQAGPRGRSAALQQPVAKDPGRHEAVLSIAARLCRKGGGGYRDDRGAHARRAPRSRGARPVPRSAARLRGGAARPAERGGGGSSAAILLYLGADSGFALLVFLVIASTGMTLGWALRSSWRFSRSLASMAVSLLVALVAYGVILWLVFGLTLTDLKQVSYDSIANAGLMYNEMGVSSASVDAVSTQLRKLVDVSPYLAPGLLGMSVVLVAAATLGLAYLIFPRLRQKVAVSMSLSTFRMHWAVAYASIVGLAMLLFSRGDAQWHSVLLYAGIDVLLVSQTLFFLQALGVLRWFGASRQWRPGSRTALFRFGGFRPGVLPAHGPGGTSGYMDRLS